MVDQATWQRLGPAPRAVPFSVRLQLLASGTATAGASVLGLGLALGLTALLSARPWATLRLARNAQETPGGLIAVEPTHYTENDQPVYRCHYVYRTPDGTDRRGTCYTLGKPLTAPRPGAERDPKQQTPVVVEYDRDHPEISRIKGQRLAPLAHVFALVLLTPLAIGLVITAYGVAVGARRAHLLENGELAQATLISAALASHEEGNHASVPFEEFRARHLASHAAALDALPEHTKQNIKRVAVGFMRLWTCGVVVIFGFGLVTVLGGLVIVLTHPDGAMQVNGRPAERSTALLFLTGFLLVWTIVGSLFIAAGRRGLRTVAERRPEPVASPVSAIRCTSEFRPPHGEPVLTTDSVNFHESLGASGSEPVLYDPDRPTRAILLRGVSSAFTISELGEWLPTETTAPWLRTLFALACLVGLPWAVWTFWNLS